MENHNIKINHFFLVSQCDTLYLCSIILKLETMEEKRKHMTMRLSPKLVLKIEELAKKENRSFNNMVETLLEKAVSGS